MNLANVRGALTCLLLTLALSASVHAQQRYLDGVHYKRLPDAVAAEANSVVEIFWYGCGSCYAFDPLLNAWVAAKGDSIAFARSPVIWDANTKQHARLFFATQLLGVHAEVHGKIFDAIHNEGNYLLDADAMASFVAQYGVDAETFSKTLASFGVDSELRKTETLQRGMALPGVPALLVGGTYLINVNNQVPTHQAMLDVADFLLQGRSQRP